MNLLFSIAFQISITIDRLEQKLTDSMKTGRVRFTHPNTPDLI